MLNDDVRTITYATFILSNPSVFRARCRPRHGNPVPVRRASRVKKLFAIDASKIADKAEEIVKTNGYADVITYVVRVPIS